MSICLAFTFMLLSVSILETNSQTITGNNILCNTNNQCENYNLECEQGSDCVINCINTLSGHNNQCLNATVQCPDNRICAIHCDGEQSCRDIKINGNNAVSLTVTTSTTGARQLYTSTINCPNNINSDCKVECDNRDQQCQHATINALQSGSLSMTCSLSSNNIANDICTDVTIICPTQNIDGSCSIEGIDTSVAHSRNMNIYALYGFKSVDIIGFSNIGTMFCNTGYLSSCAIGMNTCTSCSGSGCACNNPIVTANTIQPTSSPSAAPSTLRPTHSPVAVPTLNPTLIPTYFPSYSPTMNYDHNVNIEIIINNETDINNITDIIRENLSPNTLIAVVSVEISGDSIIAILSVSSMDKIETDKIEKSLNEKYGDKNVNVEVIENDTTYAPAVIKKSDNTALIISLTLIALVIICIIGIGFMYYRNRKKSKITDPDAVIQTKVHHKQLKSTSITIASMPSTDNGELIDMSSNTPFEPLKAKTEPENDPEIRSEGGSVTRMFSKSGSVNNNHMFRMISVHDETPQIPEIDNDDMYDKPKEKETPGMIKIGNEEENENDDDIVLPITKGGIDQTLRTPKNAFDVIDANTLPDIPDTPAEMGEANVDKQQQKNM